MQAAVGKRGIFLAQSFVPLQNLFILLSTLEAHSSMEVWSGARGAGGLASSIPRRTR